MAAPDARQRKRPRRAACRPAGSSRKAHSAQARRPSAQARMSFIWGPEQAYTTCVRLASLLFLHQRERRKFIPIRRAVRHASVSLASLRLQPVQPGLTATERRPISGVTGALGLSPAPAAAGFRRSGARASSLGSARQACSAASSARFSPTWDSCSATACRQPASTSAASASGSANLSLLCVIARSAMATTLSRPSCVSWERTSPLSRAMFRASSSSRASRRRASGGEVRVELGDLLAVGLQQPGMIEERARSAAPRGRAAAWRARPARCCAPAATPDWRRAAVPSRDRSARARAATRQSSWVLSRRLPAKRGVAPAVAPGNLAHQLAVLRPQGLRAARARTGRARRGRRCGRRAP